MEYSLEPMAGFIARLQAAVNDLSPLMDEIGGHLCTEWALRFETKRGPDGKPWAALAARTIARRMKTKGKAAANDILVYSGDLADSLSHQANSDQVVISLGVRGNTVAYAATHQFGAVIRMRERTQNIYRKVDKHGNLKRGFVKRKKSNFSQEVKVGAHTITIPARPVLGVSAEDRLAINKIVEEYFLKLSYGQ